MRATLLAFVLVLVFGLLSGCTKKAAPTAQTPAAQVSPTPGAKNAQKTSPGATLNRSVSESPKYRLIGGIRVNGVH